MSYLIMQIGSFALGVLVGYLCSISKDHGNDDDDDDFNYKNMRLA